MVEGTEDQLTNYRVPGLIMRGFSSYPVRGRPKGRF
jgi:hypothetical protein